MTSGVLPTVILVDGSNLFHASKTQFASMQDLLDACLSYSGQQGAILWIAFDGNGPLDSVGERALGGGHRVVTTGSQEADTWIAAEAQVASGAGHTVWSVTSDHALQTLVEPYSQLVLEVEAFAQRLKNEDISYKLQETNSNLQNPSSESALGKRISQKERDLLERIRRQGQ